MRNSDPSDKAALRVAFERAFAFRASLPTRPVTPPATSDDLACLFGGATPERGELASSVIEALADAADSGLMGSAGARFFGWVIGGSHPVGVAADWLTSAWGQNAGLYAASPAAATAEMVSANWLLDMLRLPQECSVGFVSGATMANFTCLAAARNAMLNRNGWDVEAFGLQGAPRMRILIGNDAHASVFAALRYLGFGAQSAERVPTDSEGRMIAAALEKKLSEGVQAPAIVIAQAGQINTGAFDLIDDIAALCNRYGVWLHVDAAFGLWARLCPEFDDLTCGLDRADSWAVDGHKWLQIPYDCGFAIVRDAEAHRRAMSIRASYLPAHDYEPGDFVPELSRRARGFATWAMLRALGRNGVAEMVRRHCQFARDLALRLTSEPGIRVVNDVVLNQVIVRFGEDDALTHATIAALLNEGVCFAAGAEWRGAWVMRVSIISAALDDADISRLAAAIIRAWRRVRPLVSPLSHQGVSI
ncbi:MAG: aspartate aminotransferase family protein [Caulobacterales bacterium]